MSNIMVWLYNTNKNYGTCTEVVPETKSLNQEYICSTDAFSRGTFHDTCLATPLIGSRN